MNFLLKKVRFNKSIYRVDPTSVGNTTNSVDPTSVGNTSNSVSSTSLEFTPNQIQDLRGPYDYEELPFNREKANNFEGFFPEDDDSEYGEEPYQELPFNRKKANNFKGFFPEDEEIDLLERSITYYTDKVVFPKDLLLSQAHEMLDYYRFVMESQCPGLTPCYANPIFEDKESVLRSANLYKEYWQKNKCNSLLTDEECHTKYYRHIGLFYDKSKENAESNGIGPLERSPGIYGDSSDYDSEEEENSDTDEEPNEELPVRYEPCSCKEHQGSMYQRVSCTANKVKMLREKEDFTEQPEEEENFIPENNYPDNDEEKEKDIDYWCLRVDMDCKGLSPSYANPKAIDPRTYAMELKALCKRYRDYWVENRCDRPSYTDREIDIAYYKKVLAKVRKEYVSIAGLDISQGIYSDELKGLKYNIKNYKNKLRNIRVKKIKGEL